MKDFLGILNDLSYIPNAPFAPKARLNFIKDLVKQKDLKYEENDVALIVRAGNNNSEHKIVLMSHVDHPGFVIKNNNLALALGSLYLDKISKFYKTPDQRPEVEVYNNEGGIIGKVALNQTNTLEISTDIDVPTNSQGLWAVDKYKEDKTKIYCISHDNDLPSAIMLDLLGRYSDSNYEILFVFTIYEEVHQYSSYALARNNLLGITSKDIIINLESMKSYNIAEDKTLIKKKVDYTSGPILNITEKFILYGDKFKDKRNKAEDLINNIVDANKIPLQRGIAGGSSDARPFSQFGRTPNIVTLNVPNKYKHNVKPNGEIVPEEVLLKDAKFMRAILEKVLTTSPKFDEIQDNKSSISLEVKKRGLINFKSEEKKKLRLNERLYWAFKAKARRRTYYATNPAEHIEDFFLKVFSYIVYFLRSL